MSIDDSLLERFAGNDGLIPLNPIIRDCDVRVDRVLALLAAGQSDKEILATFPSLNPDDIRACITYAYHCVAGELVLGKLVTH